MYLFSHPSKLATTKTLLQQKSGNAFSPLILHPKIWIKQWSLNWHTIEIYLNTTKHLEEITFRRVWFYLTLTTIHALKEHVPAYRKKLSLKKRRKEASEAALRRFEQVSAIDSLSNRVMYCMGQGKVTPSQERAIAGRWGALQQLTERREGATPDSYTVRKNGVVLT